MASKASMLKSGVKKTGTGLFAGMSPINEDKNSVKSNAVVKKVEEIVEETPIPEPIVEAEAEQAKVRARVAKARLEAAQARLEAEEAEEKLLETQAKLAAKHEAMQDKAGVDGKKGNSNRKNGNGKKKR